MRTFAAGRYSLTTTSVLMPIILSACSGTEIGQNDLSAMSKARVTIRETAFDVWLARSDDEITKGLMQVPDEDLAPQTDGTQRGMLFVFDREFVRAFWMFNTPTPLDIAYARTDGTIVTIRTMKPFDTSTYSSVFPAQFALEVKAGTFKELGIFEGDKIMLPDGL